MRFQFLLIAFVVAAGLVRSVFAAQYLLTDLGVPAGYQQSDAYGINNAGQVVVTATLTNPVARHGAFIYQNGSYQNLGTLGGDYTTAVAINTAGEVTGESWTTGDAASHAYLFSNGTMQDLGTLGPGNSAGTAINSAGQVVGRSDLGVNSLSHGFLWSNGHMADLGGIRGRNSTSSGINSAGQVVGSGTVPSGAGVFYPFLFGATITELDSVEGYASAINDASQIAGATTGGNNSLAVLYAGGAGGPVTNLGTLGGVRSSADAINSSGIVVGVSDTKSSGSHAFVLSQNGAMLDLNGLIPARSGWVLREARGINDQGEIVGYGTNPTGQTDAFLLTPVPAPEPSTIGGELLALALMFRRHRRSAD